MARYETRAALATGAVTRRDDGRIEAATPALKTGAMGGMAATGGPAHRLPV